MRIRMKSFLLMFCLFLSLDIHREMRYNGEHQTE